MRKSLLIFSLFVAGFSFAGRYDIVPSSSSGSSTVLNNDVLSRPVSINVRNVGLPYLFSLVSQTTGVPIILRDIAYPQQIVNPTQTATAGATGSTAQAQNEYLTISYFAQGKPLWQVLDEITGYFDLWWKYEAGRVVVYKYESKVYRVALPFLQKKIDEKNNSLSVSYTREFANGLEEKFRNLLRDSNSKVSVDEMGNIYVYARPSEVRLIEEAIKQINSTFTKEIPLKVSVFLVSDTDFKSLGVGAKFNSGSVSGTLNSALLNPIFSLSIATRHYLITLDTLARSGKAKLIEDSLLYALNGQPIYYSPLKKQRIVSKFQLEYISAVSGSEGGSNTTTTTVPTITTDTEDIEEGTTLIIVPYYIGEDSIVVDLYRKQSNIDEIKVQKVNLAGFENQVSLPILSTRTNLNQTVLKKGQTLVLFSNAYTLEQLKESGIPFLKDIPVLGLLFGTKEKTNETYRLVITITFGEGNEDRAGQQEDSTR